MLSSQLSVSQTAKRDHKIAVFGAAGHTGRFVIAVLERRGIGSILAGRDAEKLSRVTKAHPASEIRVASVDDPRSLDRALAGSSLIINCAGPFLDTAGPIIEAALRARIHYLDVSAEQQVALAAFERFSEPARTTGIVIVPAMAFYGGLGDLLASAAMSDWTTADEIRLGVALDGWKPTRGTRLTGNRNPGRRFVFSKSELSLVDDPPPKMQWDFPPPFGRQEVVAFPLAETVVISRHLRTPEICMYLNLAPLAELHDPYTPAPTAADERGRSGQTFLMDVVVRKGDEERRATAAGRDIYAITAPLAVEAAERIITFREHVAGTFAPGQIFDAKDFLERLGSERISFDMNLSRNCTPT
jgi:short subunit dehydrogenase-like uncharacterized protein